MGKNNSYFPPWKGGKRWPSAELNNDTYFDYFNRFKNIGINRIGYRGMPKTIDIRYVEKILWEQGQILFFKDPVIGFLCLPFTGGGERDYYDVPLLRTVNAANGRYHALRSYKDSVIIYNNYNRNPDWFTVDLFAHRVADIKRTIDVNIKGQKTPKIIRTTNDQQLVARNLQMQIEGNLSYIVADKDMASEVSLEVLDTTAPYVADKLETQLHMEINEMLTYYGIENSNEDKKERLVADEVGSNYGFVENSRNVALAAREQGFSIEIPKIFPDAPKIEPYFKSFVNTTVNSPNLGQEVQDGEIYD